MAITTFDACSITYPHTWTWCNYIFSCNYTYYTINITWLQPLCVCVSSLDSQLHTPDKTYVYDYNNLQLHFIHAKGILTKKMEAHQVYVGLIRICKRKESYLFTVWNNLNHAGHIPSLKI